MDTKEAPPPDEATTPILDKLMKEKATASHDVQAAKTLVDEPAASSSQSSPGQTTTNAPTNGIDRKEESMETGAGDAPQSGKKTGRIRKGE
jgi:hypothetical protein